MLAVLRHFPQWNHLGAVHILRKTFGSETAISASLPFTPKILPPQNFQIFQIYLPKIKISNFFTSSVSILFNLAQSSKLELQFACSSMAQLLTPSPVFTEALKFQNPLPNGCSRSPWRMLAKPGSSLTLMGGHGGGRRRRRGFSRLRVATDDSPSTNAVADDYYSVLGLLPDATPAQIKKAYYNCMKACHPDLSGDNPDTNNFCMFINEVYEVLSDPVQRMVYDEIHGYALTAINPFLNESAPKDHAFVDEFSCIGCKNCASVAPDVFGIEEDFGRARVYSQCGSVDLVQQAIDSCPVDCIHWTSAAQLSLLEDEMRRVERVNVALMLAGMGSSVDVFRMASSRWQKRQSQVLEQAKIRMMKKKKDSDKTESYWDNIWGNTKDYQNSEEEVKERARRAAAAARRWREYSRRGADKPPSYKLPEAISNNEK